MTILVYRDHVLASDSQLINRQWTVVGTAPKIGQVELDDGIYFFGATGDFAYCAKFMKWCRSDDFKKFIQDEEFTSPAIAPTGKEQACTGFVVKPDGDCIRFEHDDPPYVVRGDWYTFGSGDTMAIGALAAGAGAEEAVRIVCDWDPPSKGPVQVLRRKVTDKPAEHGGRAVPS